MLADLLQHCILFFFNLIYFFQIIDKVSFDRALQELSHVHKTFHGLSDEDAELEFIKEAQKLQEYGIHFYKVQRRTPHTGAAKVNTYFMSINLWKFIIKFRIMYSMNKIVIHIAFVIHAYHRLF